jgi:hypothetical protein
LEVKTDPSGLAMLAPVGKQGQLDPLHFLTGLITMVPDQIRPSYLMALREEIDGCMGRQEEIFAVYAKYSKKCDEANNKIWSMQDLRKIILEIYVLRKYNEGNADTRNISVMCKKDGIFDKVIPPEVYHPQWKKYMVRDIIRLQYPLACRHGGTRMGPSPSLYSAYLLSLILYFFPLSLSLCPSIMFTLYR